MTTNIRQFDSVQQGALAEFEVAVEDYQRGCIGSTRRYQQRGTVLATFRRLQCLDITAALTPREWVVVHQCEESAR
jgi:hypothetical protein